MVLGEGIISWETREFNGTLRVADIVVVKDNLQTLAQTVHTMLVTGVTVHVALQRRAKLYVRKHVFLRSVCAACGVTTGTLLQ